jgi:NADPH:quinone reductase-like Zn-dependent oxidoreductase
LSDGAGEVVEVGSGVTALRPGDRVVGGFFASWTSGPARRANLDSALGGDLDGVLSERVVLEAAAVTRIPEAFSFAEAATFPCAGTTAWHALMGDAFPSAPGDVVLTLGTGGVSVFALQIAKLAGATVIATSSSPAKVDRLRELGADAVLDYTTDDWDASHRGHRRPRRRLHRGDRRRGHAGPQPPLLRRGRLRDARGTPVRAGDGGRRRPDP